MKTWEEMSELEQLCAIHYDMYKDVYGIRPRWYNYEGATVEEMKSELDFLAKEMERVVAEEKAQQAEAIVRFERQVADLMTANTISRVDALRWIHQAEETNGDDEYLCFCAGLPYGYFRQAA